MPGTHTQAQPLADIHKTCFWLKPMGNRKNQQKRLLQNATENCETETEYRTRFSTLPLSLSLPYGALSLSVRVLAPRFMQHFI